MTETSATFAVVLDEVAKQLREEIVQTLEHVEHCQVVIDRFKHNDRAHWVNVDHLRVIPSVEKAKLPDAVWLSVRGATLIDALEALNEADLEVRRRMDSLDLVKSKSRLGRLVDPQGPWSEFESRAVTLEQRHPNWLTTKLQDECLDKLSVIMRSPAEEEAGRAALGEYMVELFEKLISFSKSELGYVDPPRKKPEMTSGEMLQRATRIAAARDTRPNRCIMSEVRMVNRLDNHRIFALAVAAFRESAERAAKHKPFSTVNGTMAFLKKCEPALRTPSLNLPPKAQSSSDFLLQARFERTIQQVNDYLNYFAGDLRKANEEIDEALGLIQNALDDRVESSA
ncbi:MAG TPA: hypothetical protein V6C76_10295 [Drouetiella sp.]